MSETVWLIIQIIVCIGGGCFIVSGIYSIYLGIKDIRSNK